MTSVLFTVEVTTEIEDENMAARAIAEAWDEIRMELEGREIDVILEDFWGREIEAKAEIGAVEEA